ncbi:hypothetical protein AB4Y45_34955 [Paraburkholderia sp. EG287A]|uniref:hypothetical protein n=1 Tax=Paraburkholderia sp. EG287A TaxID=3237012 RepID=UPI0034D1E098
MNKALNTFYGVVTVAFGLFLVPYVVDVGIPTLARQHPAVHTYGVPAVGLVLGLSVALGLRDLIDRFRTAS